MILSEALNSGGTHYISEHCLSIASSYKFLKAIFDIMIQALASLKEGEDAFIRIGQVLDSIDYQQLATNSSLPVMKPQEQVNGSSNHHSWSICSSSEPLLNDASGPK